MQHAMEAEYNESQMSAVTAGLDRSPVVLIQVCVSLAQCQFSSCFQGTPNHLSPILFNTFSSWL